MKKTLSILLTIAVGVFTGGCSGKLSTSKAEQLIKEKYFGDKDALTCDWGETIQTLPGGKYSLFGPPRGGNPCMKALGEVGALANVAGLGFQPGPKGSIDAATLQFTCGRRVFGSINSIATEGNAATVKYTRATVTDKGVIGKVSACALRDAPKDGDLEREIKFVKDDGGNWRIK